MRINPVNNNYNAYKRANNQNFRGVHSFDKVATEEVLGSKFDIYNKVTEEKRIDIWLFKKTKGGMAKMNDGYIAIIQDKDDGSVIKEIKCGSHDDMIKSFKHRLEDSVVWAKAASNMPAMVSMLQDNDTIRTNPKFAKRLLDKLKDTGSANQMNGWAAHLKEI